MRLLRGLEFSHILIVNELIVTSFTDGVFLPPNRAHTGTERRVSHPIRKYSTFNKPDAMNKNCQPNGKLRWWIPAWNTTYNTITHLGCSDVITRSNAYRVMLDRVTTAPDCKADASRFAPSQWDTSLQSNAVSHSLDANLELAQWLYLGMNSKDVEHRISSFRHCSIVSYLSVVLKKMIRMCKTEIQAYATVRTITRSLILALNFDWSETLQWTHCDLSSHLNCEYTRPIIYICIYIYIYIERERERERRKYQEHNLLLTVLLLTVKLSLFTGPGLQTNSYFVRDILCILLINP